MKLLNSIKATAQLSGLGEHRIRHLVKTDPTFPYIRIGNTVKINFQVFSEWLKDAAENGRTI